MALSMGEERILAEIEHHLVLEEPMLAEHLQTFGRRARNRGIGQGTRVRLRRWGAIGTVVLLAALFVTMIVAVAREPSRLGEQQQPERPPAGPAVVVPPAGENTAPAPARDHSG